MNWRGALSFRDFLRPFVPPIVLAVVRRLRPGSPAEREYFGTTWPRDPPLSWNDNAHEATLRRNWPIVANRISGTGALNMLHYRSDQADLPAHNGLMTFLYVMARAAHKKDHLSVLDWGGAVGHYALVGRRLLPEITFDFVIKELPANCRVARELNPGTTFVSSDDECFSRRYDVVMANNAVQYEKNWQAMVARLSAAATSWLLITCLPVVSKGPSFVVVQRLRSSGFVGEFYSNVVNRDEFVREVIRNGFVLERELMSWGPVPYHRAPEDTVGAGFLFRRS